MKTWPLPLLAIVLFASCDKEDRLRHRYSGVYKVAGHQRFWPQADSSVSFNDMGTLGLYDNDNNPYNNVVHALSDWPVSWDHNDVGGDFHDQLIGWFTDDVDGSTITFFSNPDDAFFLYAVFTVEHTGGKDYTWTYVENDAAGDLSYREVWTVTRQ